MKRIVAILLVISMIFALAACSQTDDTVASELPSSNTTQSTDLLVSGESTTETDSAKGDKTTDGKILIAYFSYGENANLPDDVDASASASIQILNGKVTGNTGLIANYIQKATNGDLFSIRTEKNYADSYDEVIDEGQAEKSNNEKPQLSTHIENLSDYDTVFIGFPNWWYGMPMVMYSFFDEYDFSGKTIIPFCTSGGSAFSDSISEIKNAEPNANVLEGLHISASSASGAENEVTEWVNGLSLAK